MARTLITEPGYCIQQPDDVVIWLGHCCSDAAAFKVLAYSYLNGELGELSEAEFSDYALWYVHPESDDLTRLVADGAGVLRWCRRNGLFAPLSEAKAREFEEEAEWLAAQPPH